MVDEPTLGEVSRQLSDWREISRKNDESTDNRLTNLAGSMVSPSVYSADRGRVDDKFEAMNKLADERYKQLTEDIAELKVIVNRGHVKAEERSKTIASNRFVLITTVLSALVFPLVLFFVGKL